MTLAGHARKPPKVNHQTHGSEAATNRFVPLLAMGGYILYLTFGFISTSFPRNSFGQAASWQIGTTGAITANVLAGVWLARRGDDLAASGFTMLGIVQTVFFSSIIIREVDYRIAASGAVLMVPSMLLIACCTLFPIWVKGAGLVMCALFVVEYFAIVSGTHRADDALQTISFISAQVLGVIWGIYFMKDARKTRAHPGP